MRHVVRLIALVSSLWLVDASARAADEAEAGARAFRVCAACHSVEPGRHMTGPSLAEIWGRKAGTVEGFHRYSEALKRSGVVWNETTLDAWLRDPEEFIPDNRMVFKGVADDEMRADIVAFLRSAGDPGGKRAARPGTMASGMPNLKEAPPDARVRTIRYCGDTYHVTTSDGVTTAIWEFNLRFKTDSSDRGPAPGAPVALRAGMMGDRAFVIFAAPDEISAVIESRC